MDTKRAYKPNDPLLVIKKVQERTTLSRPHIYRLIQAGKFPKAIRVGVNRVAWLESEINDWIAQRVASS